MFKRSTSYHSEFSSPLITRKHSCDLHNLSINRSYSEISSYPACSESLKQQFKEQLGFSITSIASQDVTEAVNLFAEDLPSLCQRAAKELTTLINLSIPTCKATLPSRSTNAKHVCLQLQFLPRYFPFSSLHSLANDTSIQSSLLKRDQLTQHVSNLMQVASGLSKHLIYKNVNISAVNWESCTVFVSVALPVLLGCLAVKGFNFSPKWNDEAYEKLFKRALLTTSYKHDKKMERFNQLLTSCKLSKNVLSSTTSMPDCTIESVENMDYNSGYQTLRSHSEPCMESPLSIISEDELLTFTKKNLTILQGNGSGSTYQNPQNGNNIALIGMMELLGFSVAKDSMQMKESLVAILSLEERNGLEFKLEFSQSSKFPKRKTSHA